MFVDEQRSFANTVLSQTVWESAKRCLIFDRTLCWTNKTTAQTCVDYPGSTANPKGPRQAKQTRWSTWIAWALPSPLQHKATSDIHFVRQAQIPSHGTWQQPLRQVHVLTSRGTPLQSPFPPCQRIQVSERAFGTPSAAHLCHSTTAVAC